MKNVVKHIYKIDVCVCVCVCVCVMGPVHYWCPSRVRKASIWMGNLPWVVEAQVGEERVQMRKRPHARCGVQVGWGRLPQWCGEVGREAQHEMLDPQWGKEGIHAGGEATVETRISSVQGDWSVSKLRMMWAWFFTFREVRYKYGNGGNQSELVSLDWN